MAGIIEASEPRGLTKREVLGLGAAVALLAACSGEPPAKTTSPPRSSNPRFQSGMTLTSWTRGELGSSEGKRQLERIADTGADAVSLIPTHYQKGAKATVIYEHPQKTSSNNEVISTIDRAHDLGMGVLLKPHVDAIDESWRGFFGQGFNSDQRGEWFDSYRKFILPYAQIAGKHGVEVFSVGCELKTLSPYADEWAGIIDAVRNEFGGTITYAANYDEPGPNEPVAWYKELDAIGIDDYTPYTPQDGPQTPEGLAAFWRQRFSKYNALSDKYDRPYLLTETGCSSSVGGWADPSQPGKQPNQGVQADFYNAIFDGVPSSKGSVRGIYLWNWYINIPSDQATNLSPQGKKAQTVFATYNRQRVRK